VVDSASAVVVRGRMGLGNDLDSHFLQRRREVGTPVDFQMPIAIKVSMVECSFLTDEFHERSGDPWDISLWARSGGGG